MYRNHLSIFIIDNDGQKLLLLIVIIIFGEKRGFLAIATHPLICSLHSCQIQTFWPPLLEPSQMLLQGTSAWRNLFLLDSQRQSTEWFQRSVCEPKNNKPTLTDDNPGTAIKKQKLLF